MFFPWGLVPFLYLPRALLAHSSAVKEQLRYFEYVHPQIEFVAKGSFERHSSFRMSITNFNRTLHLLLEPNTRLVHSNLDRGNNPYLVYSGHVYDSKSTMGDEFLDHHLSQNQNLGWASIMVHDVEFGASYDGAVHFEGTTYTILPVHDYNAVHGSDIPSAKDRPRQNKKATSVVFRSQDLGHPVAKRAGCETSDAPVQPHHSSFQRLLRRSDGGCTHDNKILYMVVVADCTYVQRHQTADKAKAAIIRDWNIVSGIYKKNFGLQLGIVDIFAPHESCQAEPFDNMGWNRGCSAKYKLKDRLDDFSVWAGKTTHPRDTLFHLVTNCASEYDVGLAFKGTLCSQLHQQVRYGGGTAAVNLGVGVSSITREPWKVIAHEIGHNFGAEHDCDEKLCSNGASGCCECDRCDCKGNFLMSPSATTHAQDFSECSKRQICQGIDILGTCLRKPDSRPIYSISMCGNGIKEEGEECDCGGALGCKGNKCCHPTECKLINSAKCDDTSDKCCAGCNPKPSGSVCRASRGSCDLVETCDGVRGTCPDDQFRPNGMRCGDARHELYCAQGLCTSRDLQCREYTEFKNTTVSDKACDLNTGRCKFLCASHGSSCTVHPGNFADGTRCGRNLFCEEGTCKGKWFDYLLDIAESNLAASIMILIAICIFLAVVMYTCIFRRFRSYSNPFPDSPPIYHSADRVVHPQPTISSRPLSRMPLVQN